MEVYSGNGGIRYGLTKLTILIVKRLIT